MTGVCRRRGLSNVLAVGTGLAGSPYRDLAGFHADLDGAKPQRHELLKVVEADLQGKEQDR